MKNLTSSNENLSVGDLKSTIDIIEQIVNVTASSGAKLKEKVFSYNHLHACNSIHAIL